MAAATGARCLLPPRLSPNGSRVAEKKAVQLKMRPPAVRPMAKFDLRPLPYKTGALEPHMSKQTLEFHWGKHHRAYVENLNKQIANTDFERNSLEEIVKICYNNGNPMLPFNNAGQVWNHDFFWSSIGPGGGGVPKGELLALIEKNFGSFEKFSKEFKDAGVTHFGSGWVWLVLKKDAKLAILKTSNALSPILWGHINLRRKYVDTFLEKLVSWEVAGARLVGAKAFVNIGEPNIPNK